MYVQQSWSLTAFDRKKLFQWSHLREYARANLSTALCNMCTCSPVECIHFSILLVYWYRLQGICFKIDYLSAFSNNFNCVFFRWVLFSVKLKDELLLDRRGGARGVPVEATAPQNFSGLFLKVLHRPLTVLWTEVFGEFEKLAQRSFPNYSAQNMLP